MGLQKTYHQPGQTLPETAKADWQRQVQEEFKDIDGEIQKAIHKEKEYERCDYRRTHCKALNQLIVRHNSCKFGIRSNQGHYSEIHALGLERLQACHGYDSCYEEESNCVKYTFDQYGSVISEAK